MVGPNKLEIVATFFYLVDILFIGSGCELAVSIHVKTTRKAFRELVLPILMTNFLVRFQTHYMLNWYLRGSLVPYEYLCS